MSSVTQVSFVWSIWRKRLTLFMESLLDEFTNNRQIMFIFLIYSRTMLIQENIVFLKSWDTWPDRCSHSALAQLTYRQALASKPTGSKSKQTLCAFQHTHTHTERERERELQLLWNFHIGLYPLPKQPLSLFPNLNPHWAVGRSQAHKKMPLTHTCL